MTADRANHTPDQLKNSALACLGDVCQDEKAPVAARVQAAKILLDFLGDAGVDTGGAGADWTLDDIDRELCNLANAGS